MHIFYHCSFVFILYHMAFVCMNVWARMCMPVWLSSLPCTYISRSTPAIPVPISTFIIVEHQRTRRREREKARRMGSSERGHRLTGNEQMYMVLILFYHYYCYIVIVIVDCWMDVRDADSSMIANPEWMIHIWIRLHVVYNIQGIPRGFRSERIHTHTPTRWRPTLICHQRIFTFCIGNILAYEILGN